MGDLFHVARASNFFDQLVVDVPELFARFPPRGSMWPSVPRPSAAHRFHGSSGLPLPVRLAAWWLLHRLRLDQGWFREFGAYWGGVLKGRPLLSPEEFHFLNGVYRMRFQDNQVPNTDDDDVHLAAWQQPEVLFQLFQQVLLESLNPKIRVIAPLHRYVPRGRCLNFGCAAGSLTATDQAFFPGRRAWVLADLPTITLHYAAWRFAGRDAVVVHPLMSTDGFRVPAGPFDAICCMTVFEHLPRPLATARQLANALATGGFLLFDYMLSDGAGLDTIQGVNERPAVLAFLREQFDVVSGMFSESRSMDLTILRKR